VLALVLVAGLVRVATYRSENVATIEPLASLSSAAYRQTTARVKATVTLRVRGRDRSITSEGTADFAHGAADLVTATAGVPRVHMVSSRRYLWLQTYGSETFGSRGAHWLVLDVARGASSTPDPTTMLDHLRGLGGDARSVGHERVDGVATTRYRAEFSIRQYEDRVPASRADVDAAIGTLGSDVVRVDVWVDGDGLPRRMEERIGSGKTRITTRVSFSDYGGPAPVVLPRLADSARVLSVREAYERLGLLPPDAG
jgi:hypothetical protein